MNSARKAEGPDNLRSWLDEMGYSQKGAGDLFGCDESMVSHMVAGRATPGLKLANRIAVLTDGAVAQADWYALDELLPGERTAEKGAAA